MLFTYVPLEFAIKVIFSRICDGNEIQTNIKRSEMKELLLLLKMNSPFTFNNDIYHHCNSVAMGCPLEPVCAGVFWGELERTLLPKLIEYMTQQKWHVDDIMAAKN